MNTTIGTTNNANENTQGVDHISETMNETDMLLMDFRHSISSFVETISSTDGINNLQFDHSDSSFKDSQRNSFHQNNDNSQNTSSHSNNHTTDNVAISDVLEKYSDRLVDLISQKLK